MQYLIKLIFLKFGKVLQKSAALFSNTLQSLPPPFLLSYCKHFRQHIPITTASKQIMFFHDTKLFPFSTVFKSPNSELICSKCFLILPGGIK